jgi:hypothetical protein
MKQRIESTASEVPTAEQTATCSFRRLLDHAGSRWAFRIMPLLHIRRSAMSDGHGCRFLKLDNGEKMQLLASGHGEAVKPGDRVLFDYILRRSNGYFLYSCAPLPDWVSESLRVRHGLLTGTLFCICHTLR